MKPIFALLAAVLLWPLLMVQAALADATYHIRPGDQLRIEVLEDTTLNRTSLVAPDGRISMPLAGSLVAAGRTVEEVQADLSTRLAPNFATAPNVFVSIDQVYVAPIVPPGAAAAPRTLSVYVIGEVNKPGNLAVKPGTTMLQLYAEMGGFSKFAAAKRVQLRRTGRDGVEKVYGFDFDVLNHGGALTGGNTVLMEGDVVFVPQRRLFE